jgi:hypothetical protein
MKFSFANFFSSRKLFVTLVAMLLVTSVAVIAGYWPAIEGVYAIFVGAVTGIAGLYVTGNVGQRWVEGKTTKASVSDGGVETPPKVEESP